MIDTISLTLEAWSFFKSESHSRGFESLSLPQHSCFFTVSIHWHPLPSPRVHTNAIMRLLLLFTLLSIGIKVAAIPSPGSAQMKDNSDGSERFGPSSHPSTRIPPTGEYYSSENYQHQYRKDLSPNQLVPKANGYQELVALCEAGLVVACQAAIEMPQENTTRKKQAGIMMAWTRGSRDYLSK